jgi:hypothetical protein
MDWTKNTALFIGRFQPWKKAHFEIVKQAMQRGDLATPTDLRTSNARQIMIMVRCVEVNDENPYTFRDIKKMITEDLSLEYPHRFEIIQVPNITNLFHGRTIGYDIDRINLTSDLETADPKKVKVTRAEKQQIDKRFWGGRQ